MRSYSNLPEEIIFDILSRLPAKSVGLCRCVSKPWRTLLCQPDFIKTHLQLAKINSLESLAIVGIVKCGSVMYSAPLNNAHHLSHETTLCLRKLSFAGYNPNSWYSIYGSCDGLLLVADNHDNKFVMNPVTREIRIMPCSPLTILPYDFCGFGYDSVRDDYKIVIISSLDTWENGHFVNQETAVDVYSLKTGIWKRLESPSYDYAIISLRIQGAFVDGCLHWLARRTRDNKHVIMTFNLVDEKFQDVPHPSLLDNLRDCKLYVLGGRLYLVGKHTSLALNLEVWVMKEYGVVESWTKVTVNYPYGWFGYFVSGDYERVVLEFGANKRIMWNREQDSSEEIVLAKLNHNLERRYIAASFVESLISPNGTSDTDRVAEQRL